ncbi:MAG: acyl carrier protein [Syntrophus sp. (in: bacteria)]
MAPGLIKTDLEKEIPLARLGTPKDVAGLIAFLASGEAAYITGQVIRVNGGFVYNRNHYQLTIQEGKDMALEAKVIELIMEQLGVTREECVPEASFVDDLGADSLDIVELIMEMEENFGIQISDDELDKIRTIQDVIDFLKTKGVK